MKPYPVRRRPPVRAMGAALAVWLVATPAASADEPSPGAAEPPPDSAGEAIDAPAPPEPPQASAPSQASVPPQAFAPPEPPAPPAPPEPPGPSVTPEPVPVRTEQPRPDSTPRENLDTAATAAPAAQAASPAAPTADSARTPEAAHSPTARPREKSHTPKTPRAPEGEVVRAQTPPPVHTPDSTTGDRPSRTEPRPEPEAPSSKPARTQVPSEPAPVAPSTRAVGGPGAKHDTSAAADEPITIDQATTAVTPIAAPTSTRSSTEPAPATASAPAPDPAETSETAQVPERVEAPKRAGPSVEPAARVARVAYDDADRLEWSWRILVGLSSPRFDGTGDGEGEDEGEGEQKTHPEKRSEGGNRRAVEGRSSRQKGSEHKNDRHKSEELEKREQSAKPGKPETNEKRERPEKGEKRNRGEQPVERPVPASTTPATTTPDAADTVAPAPRNTRSVARSLSSLVRGGSAGSGTPQPRPERGSQAPEPTARSSKDEPSAPKPRSAKRPPQTSSSAERRESRDPGERGKPTEPRTPDKTRKPLDPGDADESVEPSGSQHGETADTENSKPADADQTAQAPAPAATSAPTVTAPRSTGFETTGPSALPHGTRDTGEVRGPGASAETSHPRIAVAGPTVAAPARPTTTRPGPTGAAGRTTPSYPIPAEPGRTPTWASGVAPASPHAAEQRHAAAVSAARKGRVTAAAVTLSPKTWADLRPTSQITSTLRGSLRHKVISAPLLPERGASLAACGKGDYRAKWEEFARALASAGIETPTLDLGRGQPGAAADPKAFAGCYRQVAQAVRGVLPRARMQWTVDRGLASSAQVAAWPGDGVVDIVGIDALDTGDDWSRTVNGDGGLNWWSDFASARRARVALSGWGPAPGSPASAENASYVQNTYDWLARVAAKGLLAYDLYTEPSASRTGIAANVYRALF